MQEVPLSEYVGKHGQSIVAEQLGITQGAVWQMLKAKRNIFVRTLPTGSVEAFEVKPVGRKSKIMPGA